MTDDLRLLPHLTVEELDELHVAVTERIERLGESVNVLRSLDTAILEARSSGARRPEPWETPPSGPGCRGWVDRFESRNGDVVFYARCNLGYRSDPFESPERAFDAVCAHASTGVGHDPQR